MNIEPIAFETNIHDDGLFYRLFDEAETVRWNMADYGWPSLRAHDVSPAWRSVVRETLVGELTTFSATERFFADFADDVDFTQWLTVWLYEETKHPSALLKWLDALGEKFDSRFMLQGRQTIPFMPSKLGTLATNVVSEMVAATMYVTIAAQPNCEPVLQRICRNIGGDEARHAASFYSYAKKRLARSEDLKGEQLAMLKVLYFWTTPELNARVGHPVNLLANRYKTMPELQQAVPRDAIENAVAQSYKRACRVFESLLGLELRSVRDVGEQLAALQGS
jgi:hypothetical protein